MIPAGVRDGKEEEGQVTRLIAEEKKHVLQNGLFQETMYQVLPLHAYIIMLA